MEHNTGAFGRSETDEPNMPLITRVIATLASIANPVLLDHALTLTAAVLLSGVALLAAVLFAPSGTPADRLVHILHAVPVGRRRRRRRGKRRRR